MNSKPFYGFESEQQMRDTLTRTMTDDVIQHVVNKAVTTDDGILRAEFPAMIIAWLSEPK